MLFFLFLQKKKTKYGEGVSYSDESVLVPEKFTLGAVNVLLLKRFAQKYKRQTATGGCKKLTKGNLQEMWPKWKAVLQAVGK